MKKKDDFIKQELFHFFNGWWLLLHYYWVEQVTAVDIKENQFLIPVDWLYQYLSCVWTYIQSVWSFTGRNHLWVSTDND